MKNLVFLFVFTAWSFILQAQLNCTNFNPNTFESTINVWDWTDDSDENWIAYIFETASNSVVELPLASPFQSAGINQPNTSHLFANQVDRDYYPEDGWELILKRFGQNSPTASVSNPTFILYNRFTGVMRVFVGIFNFSGLATGGRISIEYRKNGFEKVSGLLESGTSVMNGLDGFEKAIELEIPNRVGIAEGYQWFFADVPVNYDPCTCTSSPNLNGQFTPNISAINYDAKFIQESSVLIKMNEITPDETVISNGGVPAVQAGNSTMLSNVEQTFKKLGDANKRGTEVKKSVSEAVSLVENTVNSVQKISNLFTISDSLNLTEKKDFKMPNFMDNIPYVGYMFGIFDSFISGGKSNDKGNATVPIAPKNFSLEGSIVAEGDLSTNWIYTPGSPHQNVSLNQPEHKPIYDHTLGVFGLLETPIVEWCQFSHNSTINALYVNSMVKPVIRQFRLREPIKYTINPASELELIDLQVALEYSFIPRNLLSVAPIDTTHFIDYLTYSNASGQTIQAFVPFLGPVYTTSFNSNTSYIDRLEKSGIKIANNPTINKYTNDPNGNSSMYNMTYSTGFYNAFCSNNYNFSIATLPDLPSSVNSQAMFQCNGSYFPIYELNDLDNFYFGNENIDVRLKVRAILKRKDSNANDDTEDVVILQSYKVNIESQPLFTDGKYDFSNNSNCAVPLTNTSYGVDYYISNFTAPSGFLPFPNYGGTEFPELLVLDNSNYQAGEDYFATNVIFITDNLTTLSESIIRAGNQIITLPESQLNGNFDLQINNAPFGCEEILPQQTAAQITAFCNDPNRYNPAVSAKAFVENDTTQESLKIPLHANYKIYPNPTQGNLRFDLQTEFDANISVAMYDLSGREIKRYVSNENWQQGKHQKEYDISNLSDGVYLFKFCINENCFNEKVVKTK